jgi:hypothetical protein
MPLLRRPPTDGRRRNKHGLRYVLGRELLLDLEGWRRSKIRSRSFWMTGPAGIVRVTQILVFGYPSRWRRSVAGRWIIAWAYSCSSCSLFSGFRRLVLLSALRELPETKARLQQVSNEVRAAPTSATRPTTDLFSRSALDTALEISREARIPPGCVRVCQYRLHRYAGHRQRHEDEQMRENLFSSLHRPESLILSSATPPTIHSESTGSMRIVRRG